MQTSETDKTKTRLINWYNIQMGNDRLLYKECRANDVQTRTTEVIIIWTTTPYNMKHSPTGVVTCTMGLYQHRNNFGLPDTSSDIYTQNSQLLVSIGRRPPRLFTTVRIGCHGLKNPDNIYNNMIQFNSVYLTCSKKLTGSQLSLPHEINKKLKCETKNKLMSVTGPVNCILGHISSEHLLQRTNINKQKVHDPPRHLLQMDN